MNWKSLKTLIYKLYKTQEEPHLIRSKTHQIHIPESLSGPRMPHRAILVWLRLVKVPCAGLEGCHKSVLRHYYTTPMQVGWCMDIPCPFCAIPQLNRDSAERDLLWPSKTRTGSREGSGKAGRKHRDDRKESGVWRKDRRSMGWKAELGSSSYAGLKP